MTNADMDMLKRRHHLRALAQSVENGEFFKDLRREFRDEPEIFPELDKITALFASVAPELAAALRAKADALDGAKAALS